ISHMNTTTNSAGRAMFLGGVLLVILGPIAYNVQLHYFGQFVTPWYAAAMGTLGLALIVLALIRRWTVVRLIGIALCGLIVAFEWGFLLSFSRSPEYTGPPAGQAAPSFSALRADGTPFTERDLRGQGTALVFFRGRW